MWSWAETLMNLTQNNFFINFFVQFYVYSGRSNMIASPLSKPESDIYQYMLFFKDNFNGFLRETKCKFFLSFPHYSFWYRFMIIFQYYADLKWHCEFFVLFCISNLHICYNSFTNYYFTQWISLWICYILRMQVFETSVVHCIMMSTLGTMWRAHYAFSTFTELQW